MTSPRLLAAPLVCATLLAAAWPAAAQDSGSFLVRLRATHLQSDNGGGTTPDLKLSVNDKTFPELDISYFFTPNIAAELILTYPQKHDLKSDGTKVATLKHLPPTLLAQYHFTDLGPVRPYLGAGVNFTLFSGFTSSVAGVDIKNQSWGLAVQAGIDVPVGGGWLVNADIKKVQIGTDVYLNGNKIGDFKVDPWLFSVGAGYRF